VMPRWYTYVNLKELKECQVGTKCFYAAVDEFVEQNGVCSHIRMWDQYGSVVIKLIGSFARNLKKGDVARVHRLMRQHQGDVHETVGYGEPGRMTQIVAWRVKGDGEGFAVAASSSGDKYTRNDNDVEVVQDLYTAWKEKNFVPEEEDPGDEILENTIIERVAKDSQASTSKSVSQPVVGSQLLECSVNVDSFVAEDRLDSLLNETIRQEEEAEPIPPPPPLTPDQLRRLQKAVPLSDLREYTYYDVLLQVIEAYCELSSVPHAVMRCWDPHSTLPTYRMPLRSHYRAPDYKNRELIKPDERLVEKSKGRTVDIYCYDYDEHAGRDGRNFTSGDWLLFCNLKVGYPRNESETVLSMHSDGSFYGRCIRRVLRTFDGGIAAAKGALESMDEETREREQTVATAVGRVDETRATEKAVPQASVAVPDTEKSVNSLVNEMMEVRVEEKKDKEDEALPSSVHSFREFDKKRSDDVIPSSPPEKEEVIIPRCKTIQPYIQWKRQIVPDDVEEDPPNECMHMMSRVYCNCGVALVQGDEKCPIPQNRSKRHMYFYRNRIFPAPMCEPSTSEEVPLKNQILPSLSCISQRGMPTVFDLIVQMSYLSAERCKIVSGFPRCHISVWDGTIPPESLEMGKLRRHLSMRSDKIIVGKPPKLNVIAQRTIDVRLTNVKKVDAGEFVILRDVTIVRAFSLGTDDGSLVPVWMLQAKDMDVIRKTPSVVEEMKSFLEVAGRISKCILNIEEEKEREDEEEREIEEKWKRDMEKIAVKRRMDQQGNTKRTKKIRLDESMERTWMDELAERDQRGIESQEDTTFTLQCTFARDAAPTTLFTTPECNAKVYDKFMTSLREGSTLPRKVWLRWMKTCITFNTIKDRTQQQGCCRGCDGQVGLFAYIPIKNPMDSEKCIHLLIDASHFREDQANITWSQWKKNLATAKQLDTKNIVNKINSSTFAVHRVSMMHLQATVVFVVFHGNEWLTVSSR
ncbi:hypothetical protein PMAYCL1PPCAC_02853, partial [Pristionchus mayeri]